MPSTCRCRPACSWETYHLWVFPHLGAMGHHTLPHLLQIAQALKMHTPTRSCLICLEAKSNLGPHLHVKTSLELADQPGICRPSPPLVTDQISPSVYHAHMGCCDTRNWRIHRTVLLAEPCLLPASWPLRLNCAVCSTSRLFHITPILSAGTL